MMKKPLLFIAVAMIFFFCSQTKIEADSWWGDGYRDREWVLSHGGTVIEYKIITKGSDNKYKAILYQDGKVVEWENGKTGKFDDPKNGTYVVKALKGGVEENKTSKGGKKILSSGPIMAHPGETIFVTLNDLTGEVLVTSDRRAVAKKPTVKSATDVKTEAQGIPVQAGVEPEKIEQFNAEDIGKFCVEDIRPFEFKYAQDGLTIGMGLLSKND